MLLETFLKDITTIIDSAVVKYSKIAFDNETVTSQRYAESYNAILEGLDSFDTYPTFMEEAIVMAGVAEADPDATDIDDYVDTTKKYASYYAHNKNEIPIDKRSAVLKAQRELITESYKSTGDLNNYYRMLSGLPDIGDEGIPIPEEWYKRFSLLSDAEYIHQLSNATITKITNAGYMEDILKNNPTKEYLRHLGSKRIDPIIARRSNNFALLYMDSENVPLSFYGRFNKIYEQNRQYVCGVLYNNNLSNSYELYDNFMGMCIMFMTMQRMVVNTFSQGIERDLYDWEFIKSLYATYNIPFNESIPMDTHMNIVKNINNLLRYKATDKVLFDIASLLGYADIGIDRYFLVKSIKYDENGKPIVVRNKDGSIDYNATYNLQFKSIDMKETNISSALQKSSATKTYEEVTESDPLWWDSGDLKNKILEEDFNYYESKYISLNLMYNMTDVLFEITYAFNAVLDNKDKIDANFIGITLPKIEYGKVFSLFDVITFIIAGICKMNGFAGNIPDSTADITTVYGYKYKAYNGDTLSYLYDTETYTDIVSGNVIENIKMRCEDDWEHITDVGTFNTLFEEIKAHRESLVKAMWETDDIHKYNAYRRLYDIQLTKDYVTTAFTKKDGTMAKSYIEYLEDSEPILANVLKESGGKGDKSLYSVLSHAIGRLEENLESLVHLDQLIDDSEVQYRALMSLINFFKSYTVDVHSFNIWYVFDSKYYNAIRLINHLTVHGDLYLHDSLNELFYDILYNKGTIETDDRINLRDELKFIWEE